MARKRNTDPIAEKIKEIPTSFIKPLIRSNDEKHELETMVENDEAPEIKSVGYMPLKAGVRGWVSYTITTKGDKVINMEISEPDLRDIAEESAKIAFVQTFHDQAF